MANKNYLLLMATIAVVLVILRVYLNSVDSGERPAASKKDLKVLRLDKVNSELKNEIKTKSIEAEIKKKEEINKSNNFDDESDEETKDKKLKKDDFDDDENRKNERKKKNQNKDDILSNEDRINRPVVLVAGNHGSGTTLMRAILDVKLNCGYETRVIPEILNFVHNIKHSKNFRLKTKIYSRVIDKALSLFIIEIMKKNDNSYDILCSKDPGRIDLAYLSELFSKLKVIYMVRDGRASVLSNLERKNKPIVLSTFYKYMDTWNKINRDLHEQCIDIGSKKCKIVKYEELVTNPEPVLRDIMNFAGIEFTKEFLNHEEHSSNINKANGKVQNEINTDRLRTWVGKVSYDRNYMINRFEMFEKLGYEL